MSRKINVYGLKTQVIPVKKKLFLKKLFLKNSRKWRKYV